MNDHGLAEFGDDGQTSALVADDGQVSASVGLWGDKSKHKEDLKYPDCLQEVPAFQQAHLGVHGKRGSSNALLMLCQKCEPNVFPSSAELRHCKNRGHIVLHYLFWTYNGTAKTHLQELSHLAQSLHLKAAPDQANWLWLPYWEIHSDDVLPMPCIGTVLLSNGSQNGCTAC